MGVNNDDEIQRYRNLSDDVPETLQQRIRRHLLKTFPIRAVDLALSAANTQAPAIIELARWAERRDDGIAILSGVPGSGKTVAATWLAAQRAGGWMRPHFLLATEFAKLSRYDAATRERWGVPWLVLDDLGAEYLDVKGSFKVDLDELVDVAYSNKRTLIITTNCTASEFRDRYGARVVDRVRECGAWIAITAGSMRRPEAR